MTSLMTSLSASLIALCHEISPRCNLHRSRARAQLAELRMDENDLAGDASTLAPLCKLRFVRTLSLEKNRLLRVR